MEGCGHRDMYTTLTQVLKEEYPTHKVFSDIGCYTLGANAPFNAINSCVDWVHLLPWLKEPRMADLSGSSSNWRLHLHTFRHDRTFGLRQ